MVKWFYVYKYEIEGHVWLNFGHIYGNGTVKVRILDKTTEEEEQFSGARPLNIDFENYPIDTGWNKEGF